MNAFYTQGPLAVTPRGHHSFAGYSRVGRCIWAVSYGMALLQTGANKL